MEFKAQDESRSNEWGLKICPVRNKQCLAEQCAWWIEFEKACAIARIAMSPER